MRTILLLGAVLTGMTVRIQAQNVTPSTFTHADTLRGSDGPGRSWWDASFYDLHVAVTFADSSIRGWNTITYRVMKPGTEMQIDLQPPLEVDSMVQDGKALTWRRDGNAFFVTLAAPQPIGRSKAITVGYHGFKKPGAGRGGAAGGGGGGGGGSFHWGTDSLGRMWLTTSNQGAGGSTWWPLKDIQSDEPDSQRIAITVPDPYLEVSNGRLRSTKHNPDGTTTFEWFESNPINNYDVAINTGVYSHFSEVYQGERGALTLDFWPLTVHLDTAKVVFQGAKTMLSCFEKWLGPFPWYNDGYKLVEVNYLGMEHQTAVAYGNKYLPGYLGRDLSGTGHGMKWDYIIVHESAHEWFGNSITSKDPADEWVHEGFAYYAEGLYTECTTNKQNGEEYLIGSRKNIQNRSPVVGPYGVNRRGSGDMYPKGANVLMMIRTMINNDEKWRQILRGLSSTFYHQTVTIRQFEEYINKQSGMNFDKLYDQYLRTVEIPTLEYRINAGTLSYKWTNVIPGFDMPILVTLTSGSYTLVKPTTEWKRATIRLSDPKGFKVDPRFYIEVKEVDQE